MSLDRFGRPSAGAALGSLAGQRVITVVRGTTGALAVVSRAGRMAAASGASLTVAWVMPPPLCLGPPWLPVIPDDTGFDDLAVSMLLDLASTLDPLEVEWRLELMAYPSARAIAQLTRREGARLVLVGGRRLLGVHYTPWVARCLRRIHGLPVLLVRPGAERPSALAGLELSDLR